jgi:Rrf2 family protein
MQISAKVDYAVRAMLELAYLQATDQDSVLTADSIATAQAIPLKFLEGILRDLRRAGFVSTTRGPQGGYCLATTSAAICVADIIRAIDGPLAEVRGEKPEDAKYSGASEHLGDVWIAVRAALRSVLETTFLSDLVDGKLSPQVLKSLKDPEAWTRR